MENHNWKGKKKSLGEIMFSFFFFFKLTLMFIAWPRSRLHITHLKKSGNQNIFQGKTLLGSNQLQNFFQNNEALKSQSIDNFTPVRLINFE